MDLIDIAAVRCLERTDAMHIWVDADACPAVIKNILTARRNDRNGT